MPTAAADPIRPAVRCVVILASTGGPGTPSGVRCASRSAAGDCLRGLKPKRPRRLTCAATGARECPRGDPLHTHTARLPRLISRHGGRALILSVSHDIALKEHRQAWMSRVDASRQSMGRPPGDSAGRRTKCLRPRRSAAERWRRTWRILYAARRWTSASPARRAGSPPPARREVLQGSSGRADALPAEPSAAIKTAREQVGVLGRNWAPRSGSRPTRSLRSGGGARCARLRGHGRNVARRSDNTEIVERGEARRSVERHVLGRRAPGRPAR